MEPLARTTLQKTSKYTGQQALHHLFFSGQKQPTLAESEAARHAIKAQLAATTVTTTNNNLASKPSSYHLPPVTTATTTSASQTSTTATAAAPLTPGNQSSYASVVASNKGKIRKKNPAARSPLPSAAKASATLGRLFGPQRDISSGYRFVYF
ncbi:hypothetical protein [Parasitella parasitica]|uniref:Uncharacterized protein n=1 Tax=Parasitella parasitica TaxID=35722 RepID=A0A0B7MM58_9FUNG|nr:hypothetical protein [Parasitella parasitica]